MQKAYLNLIVKDIVNSFKKIHYGQEQSFEDTELSFD